MLKSELVISEELNLLNSHFKHYSIRFLGRVFSDDMCPDTGCYKEERIKMLALIATNHCAEARSQLIPQMISDRDLLAKVRDIIWSKKWDFDIVVLADSLNQIGKLKEIIENCCASDQLTKEMLNEYYEESLVMLIYFNIFRSYITTTKNIYDKFQPDNIVCNLRFSHILGVSFSISQYKNIMVFIETVFSNFFTDYMDIITVEFDTGSPKLDCSIKINSEKKVKWDLSKSVTDFFNYLLKGDKAGSIRAFKKMSNLLNRDQKREIAFLNSFKKGLSQEEYEKRLISIFDSYSELRKNNIEIAIDSSRNNQKEIEEIITNKLLESIQPLSIENKTPPLLTDNT